MVEWKLIYKIPITISSTENQIRVTIPKEFKVYLDHWIGKQISLSLLKKEEKRKVVLEE